MEDNGGVLSILNKSARRAKTTATSSASNDMGLGKMPPQALELEDAILGALMLEKDALSAVIDILKPETFYSEQNALVFTAIQKLFEESKPIDILTVSAQLRSTGDLEKAGGAFRITELTNRVGSAANIEYHARLISEKFILRELIRNASETIKKAYEETTDVFELLDQSERDLFTIAEGNIRRSYDNMSSLMSKSITELETLMKSKEDGLSGVPTGLRDLDRFTGGWQKSNLVIIAARPGMGKSALVISMARNAAVNFKRPAAVFSLEMSSVELVNRLIAAEAELDSEKLKKGNLQAHEWQQLNHKVGPLSEAPIFIDDTPALTIFELRAKCRRLKAQHDIQLVIIDYLQLMSGGSDLRKGSNREQEIAAISRALKTLAKELEIPVIALSQLSRAVEQRGGDKRPQLSDLRESGSIEQDADMVCFIYRPEYYGLLEDAEGRSLQGIAKLIIAKHRNGATGDVDLKFIGRFAKFDNLDSFEDIIGGNTPPPSAGTIKLGSKMNDMDNSAPPF